MTFHLVRIKKVGVLSNWWIIYFRAYSPLPRLLPHSQLFPNIFNDSHQNIPTSNWLSSWGSYEVESDGIFRKYSHHKAVTIFPKYSYDGENIPHILLIIPLFHTYSWYSHIWAAPRFSPFDTTKRFLTDARLRSRRCVCGSLGMIVKKHSTRAASSVEGTCSSSDDISNPMHPSNMYLCQWGRRRITYFHLSLAKRKRISLFKIRFMPNWRSCIWILASDDSMYRWRIPFIVYGRHK